MSIMEILQMATKENASDVHIVAGNPPIMRVHGRLVRLNIDPLTLNQSKELCYSLISDEQKSRFEKEKDLDFSFAIDDIARFRGHLFYQKRSIGGSFRQIPSSIPNIRDIGLPSALLEIAKKPFGLVLVTGPTGSGKSTSLAAMLNEINAKRSCHILTIEDPIEYAYTSNKAMVTQREIGLDVKDFHQSLRAALRMDPDVILIGELRDTETIKIALEVAETGHLTFGTVHTNNAFLAVERILGSFGGDEKTMIRTQLSQVLEGIISQRLLPSSDMSKRVAAVEILQMTTAIRHLIREGKNNQIYSMMQTDKASGMLTMNQSLLMLLQKRLISEDVAFKTSYEQKELQQLIRKWKMGYSMAG